MISSVFSHAPLNYTCPFCELLSWNEREWWSCTDDIFYSDEYITAFVSTRHWRNNHGNVLIIPNIHSENLYDISEEDLTRIHIFSQKVAVAMKQCYLCDGVSIRQHNEPAGNQDVWHYHLHVFPRYVDDQLYELHKTKAPTHPEERKKYADILREFFPQNL